MLTREEVRDEIIHLNKEVRLFSYEVEIRGANKDTLDRLDKLMKRHQYLSAIATLYGIK